MNPKTSSNQIDELMRGVIDPHVHSGPSTSQRSLDHIELIKKASDAGYSAVVTKDHYYDGAASAALVNNHYGHLGTRMFSGVALNQTTGGLNPYAVEHSANLGGKYVWLPTFHCQNHMTWQATKSPFQHPGHAPGALPERPIDVLTGNNTVVDDLKQILDIIAQAGMVLATGHLHVSEIYPIVHEAKARGVENITMNHPEIIIEASLEDVAELAQMGVYVEHSMAMFVEGGAAIFEPDLLKAHIDAAGIAQTVIVSDLGQATTIDPVSGMRESIAMLLELGYSDDAIRTMTSRNAGHLLGIA